jgi:hypothetical protein
MKINRRTAVGAMLAGAGAAVARPTLVQGAQAAARDVPEERIRAQVCGIGGGSGGIGAALAAARGCRLCRTMMTLGQAAGTAAALGIKHGVPARHVDIAELQANLRKQNVAISV